MFPLCETTSFGGRLCSALKCSESLAALIWVSEGVSDPDTQMLFAVLCDSKFMLPVKCKHLQWL